MSDRLGESSKRDSSGMILRLRHLGRQPYRQTWLAMRTFTASRTPNTTDELWLLEHEPVFTLGQAGRQHHVLTPGAIPIAHCDRGGQVTYHGPGQLVAYTLLDLRRLRLGARQLVDRLQQAVVALLAAHDVFAETDLYGPGVYVERRKIAALGLRVSRGCAYHGIALNVAMDLTPFSWIDPCGYQGLEVTQLSDLITDISMPAAAQLLAEYLSKTLGYNHISTAAAE